MIIFSEASHLFLTSPNELCFRETVVDYLHFLVHFIFVISLIYLSLEVITASVPTFTIIIFVIPRSLPIGWPFSQSRSQCLASWCV